MKHPFVETLYLLAFDRLRQARVAKVKGTEQAKYAVRVERMTGYKSSGVRWTEAAFQRSEVRRLVGEVNECREKIRELRKAIKGLAKTEPPPPSDVQMVAGE